jgi:hypothetical protein
VRDRETMRLSSKFLISTVKAVSAARRWSFRGGDQLTYSLPTEDMDILVENIDMRRGRIASQRYITLTKIESYVLQLGLLETRIFPASESGKRGVAA